MLPSFADLVQIVLRDVTLLQKKKMDMMISPSGFSAGGVYGYTCTICGGRGVNHKLLNSSKSHNFHGGRDESGLLYSLISSIGLSGGIMRG